jgi:hypothetical protein
MVATTVLAGVPFQLAATNPDEFLDAKQKYDEERDEDRESASTSITVTH